MVQARGERVEFTKRHDKSERPEQVAPIDVPARLSGALTDVELVQVVGGNVLIRPPTIPS